MKIVAPLRVDAKPSGFARRHHARIVQIALGDQRQAARRRCLQRFNFRGKLLQKVDRRAIDKSMHRVNAQSVDMKVPQPHQRVVAEEAPHLVRTRVFKIHCAAPGRVVRIHNIRPEFSGVIPARPEVVVDHIEQHGQALAMRRIHKALQRVRSSVWLVNRVERHAVITPAMAALERSYRHQLHMRDSKLGQVIELVRRGIERAFRRKRADVQLVDECRSPEEAPENLHRSTQTPFDRRLATARARHLAATANADRDSNWHRRRSRNP